MLKRVGGKEKDRAGSVGEPGYVTAEDSDTVSRRSSIASLTEPPILVHEPHGAAATESAQDRHRVIPGWQQVSRIVLAQCCEPKLQPYQDVHGSYMCRRCCCCCCCFC